jgi:signal transduction histidine kinase
MVGELVENARQTLLNSITEAHVQVDCQIVEKLPPLNVDPDLMRRVLINLIDNAVRFTPQDGKVLISAARKDVEQVAICIADSGPGIPPEDRAMIFEQYRQSGKTKPLRGSKGTGLGLTFCKLAVEAHGGTISVEASEALPGACFVVSLPIVNHDSAI